MTLLVVRFQYLLETLIYKSISESQEQIEYLASITRSYSHNSKAQAG